MSTATEIAAAGVFKIATLSKSGTEIASTSSFKISVKSLSAINIGFKPSDGVASDTDPQTWTDS